MEKTKVAVIGGGLGAMSAVHHIMHLPNAKERFDITIYQTGWRLGGKGASGVNQRQGFRVEEHGIHFWFGFYENGFQMMKDVYHRLERPKGSPLATFDEAFEKQNSMDFAQLIDGNWVKWQLPFPTIPGTLGDRQFPTVEQVFEMGLKCLADEISTFINDLFIYLSTCQVIDQQRLRHLFDRKLERPQFADVLEAQIQTIEQTLENSSMPPVERHLRVISQWLYENPTLQADGEWLSYLLHFLQDIFQMIWYVLSFLIDAYDDLVLLLGTIDFMIAAMLGMIQDNVIKFNDLRMTIDVSRINEYDFTEWLIRNGANEQLVTNNPVVRSMYDGPFAFFRGAVSTPDVEAGTALNILLRLAFTCKENIMWRMQAGMGDTIFAPIYQLFRKEFPDNVHFEFFSRVKNLKLGATSDLMSSQSVVSLDIEKQVQLAENCTHYDPLIDVKGLPCWPSEPLYDQLNLTPDQVIKLQYLQDRSSGLESDWTPWTGQLETKTYGNDFDKVLIGASLSSLPLFCPELIAANPRWATMLDRVGSVQTQAFQLWFNKTHCELGVGAQQVVSCYVEPLDTFAVMDQVLERENWPDFPGCEKPKCLVYVCGAMLDSQNIPPTNCSYFPYSQWERVFESTKEYIYNNLQFLIPGAFYQDSNDVTQFDWSCLSAPDCYQGPQRLKYQYCRANIDSSERYVYSLKGTSQYRLRADESGFQNVYLTGDWIQNGMNIGFVEGAVISGIQAAQAITGEHIHVCVPW